jgi:hypothetical protein
MKFIKLAYVIFFSFPMFSSAALIELKAFGASFNSDVTWISSFTISYTIDTTILDSNPDSEYGVFKGALKSGFLIMDSNRYELDFSYSPCIGNINTQDFSDEYFARGLLNFGQCKFIDSLGESVTYSGAFRSFSRTNFFNAGTSLHGLENRPVSFESDGELAVNGVGRYANLGARAVVQESGFLALLLLGFVGTVGARSFKAQSVKCMPAIKL